MGRRRRARTERMKCCIFELMWIGRRREECEICRKDGGMVLARGEKGKECKCIDSQSEWTGAFIDGENVGRVERSLRSEVKKEELEVKVDGKGLHIVT